MLANKVLANEESSSSRVNYVKVEDSRFCFLFLFFIYFLILNLELELISYITVTQHNKISHISHIIIYYIKEYRKSQNNDIILNANSI